MGAIAGGIDLTGKNRVGQAFLTDAWTAMVRTGHREAATFVHPHGGLAAAAGDLASSPDGSVAVAFDGHIANAEEFLTDLAGSRDSFRLHDLTDAELVLRLFQTRGNAFLSQLRGSFAIAIFETRPVRLLLVRDHVGTRPLKFFEKDGLVLFATENRALLVHDAVTPDLDLPALGHYLTFGFVPAPYTGVQHVSKVPAGHYLTADQNGAHLVRHWRPRLEPDPTLRPDQALDLVEDALMRTLPRQIQNLRGQNAAVVLDQTPASAVLAWAIKHFGDTAPPAVELVSRNDRRSRRESPASVVAKHLGLELHRVVLEPPPPEAWPSPVDFLDEPLADPTVALLSDGFARLRERYDRIYLAEGFDLVFGGYDRYGPDARTRYLFPRSLLRMLARFWPRSFPFGPALHRSIQRPTTRFLMRDEVFHEEEKRALLNPGGSARGGSARPNNKTSLELFRFWFRGTDRLVRTERFRMADLLARLPDCFLARFDACARAHGLEPCFPFLDPDLVQVAGTLPPACKTASRPDHHVLRRLAGGDLSPIALTRTRPERDFARTSRAALARYAAHVLVDTAGTTSENPCLFHPAALRHVLRETGERGARKHHALLMLELWRRSLQPTPAAHAIS